MDDQASSPQTGTAATVVSMWSAMLGGALGATMGLLSGNFVILSFLGFVFGFTSSVITVSLLLAVSYFIAAMLNSDFDDQPIGCATSSQFSGIIGGLSGAMGAMILSTYHLKSVQGNSNAFGVCWSVTALVPILLTLLLVRWARYWNQPTHSSTRLNAVLARLEAIVERIGTQLGIRFRKP